ncbi:DUF4870 domain-containing protein [Akkermansiaceae bacterium]|nr:DUF4870 domain-containing protein [Akkermansiaceae bacterium]
MEPPKQEPPYLPPTNPYQAPQTTLHPSGLSQNELNLSMWCHLIPIIAGFMSGGVLGFLGPLIILHSSRQPSSFVDQHAKHSLNFQLSVLIYGFALTILGFIIAIVTMGLGVILLIPLLFGFLIGVLVLEILATIAATKGQLYHYPLTIPFVK